MSTKNGREISASELESRRRKGIELYLLGCTRMEIAGILDVNRNTVGTWVRSWEEIGENSFIVGKAGRPKGSGCRLLGWQSATIKTLITDNTPDQLKFPFALWTRESVRTLILDRFGIDLPVRTIGDYLKRWGFTPQRPVKRAYERNEVAVARWLESEYKEIAKQAKKEGAEIHWGDETGLRSDDVVGRSYSPKGITPVVEKKGCRERLTMFSTVTNKGSLRFMIFEGSINAEILVDFLDRLIRSVDTKVYLILDNLRVHHSKIVAEFLSSHKEEISIFFLPKYSPDLNPDEFLNSDFKRELSKLPDSRKKGTLEENANATAMRIQSQPERVKGYFRAPTTLYAS